MLSGLKCQRDDRLEHALIFNCEDTVGTRNKLWRTIAVCVLHESWSGFCDTGVIKSRMNINLEKENNVPRCFLFLFFVFVFLVVVSLETRGMGLYNGC